MYGYSSTFSEVSSWQFKKTEESDTYYLADREVDLAKILSAPLPKPAPEVTFQAHWLAVNGVQPAIPQNPALGNDK